MGACLAVSVVSGGKGPQGPRVVGAQRRQLSSERVSPGRRASTSSLLLTVSHLPSHDRLRPEHRKASRGEPKVLVPGAPAPLIRQGTELCEG